MTKPLQRDAIYLKRHFDAEIIVLSVRWYITYKLSYRDLAAMIARRHVGTPSTILNIEPAQTQKTRPGRSDSQRRSTPRWRVSDRKPSRGCA
jgi:transposase-like protein